MDWRPLKGGWPVNTTTQLWKKTSATSPNLNVKILARMGFRHEFRRHGRTDHLTVTDGSAGPSWLLNPGTRTVAFGLQRRLPPEAPALGCFNAETAQAPSLDIEALRRSESVAGLQSWPDLYASQVRVGATAWPPWHKPAQYCHKRHYGSTRKVAANGSMRLHKDHIPHRLPTEHLADFHPLPLGLGSGQCLQIA